MKNSRRTFFRLVFGRGSRSLAINKVWLEITNDLSEVLFSEQDIEEVLIAAERSKLFWGMFDKLGALAIFAG